MRPPPALTLTLLLALAACGGTRQIQTAPPEPAVVPNEEPTAERPRTPLVITLEMGETALPAAMSTLRFRIAEVALRDTTGAWATAPADANAFTINGSRQRKPILTTRLAPSAYDSLAVRFADVYAEYGPNAGGPLTVPRDAPVVLPIGLVLGEAAAQLRLTLEPGASLTRTPDGGWIFAPFLVSRDE